MLKKVPLCLVIIICFFSAMEVKAAEKDTIYEYMVSIPKTIILDSNTKSSQYNISASSNIPQHYQLNIVPDKEVIMTDTADNQVTAKVTQPETMWSYDDIQAQVSKTGEIEAEDLYTGDWSGYLNFNISFTNLCGEKHQQLVKDTGIAATCTKKGLTEGEHCSKCGEITISQEEIPAKGHSYKGKLLTVDGVDYATESGGCYTKGISLSTICTVNYVKANDYYNGEFSAGNINGTGCMFCAAGTMTGIMTKDYKVVHSFCADMDYYVALKYVMNYCNKCNLITYSNFTTKYVGSYIPDYVFIRNHNSNKRTCYAFNCSE